MDKTDGRMEPMLAGSKSTNESIIDQAKQAAQDVYGRTKDQLEGQLKTQKDGAASQLGGVVSALRETSRQLNQAEQAEQAGLPAYANKAADQVERLTEYVRSRTIGDLIGDVEGFARREPAIFLGGSFALGLLAARFLKSSGHRTESRPTGEEPKSDSERTTVPSISARSASAE